MSLIDSHCHLDDAEFDSDREEVIERAQKSGIERLLTIGTGEGPPDLEAAVRLADRHHGLLATVGIHPQYAAKADPNNYRHLAELLRHPKCVALGEIGLDYHWQPYDRELQSAVFREQLAIASDAKKPVIIHTRDAWADTIRMLSEHWLPAGLPTILHCFTGGPDEAREALALGFYLSFAGVVTYPKATGPREAAKLVPTDRLLVETDAPYLPPVPHRGKRNEPSFVAHTAAKLAELREIPLSALAIALRSNFDTLFGSREINQLH